MDFLKERAKFVDRELKKVTSKKEPRQLYNPMEYHVLAGGKRIRPVLCMLACEAVGGNQEDVLPIATGIELLHAFTLAHDDIMDKDELRRGKKTLWKKHGEALAINTGDGMFAKAYESALDLKTDPETHVKVLDILTRAIVQVCEGQALDVSFEKRSSVKLDEYLNMSAKKTGSLIGASTEIGAILGRASEQDIMSMRGYGEKVGLAFQIWDDYIDFASNKTGKTYGSDIKKGKKTSIVCHALENIGGAERVLLLKILKTDVEKTTKEMIGEAVGILEASGSIEYAKRFSKDLIADAKDDLLLINDNEATKCLKSFADFVVKREV